MDEKEGNGNFWKNKFFYIVLLLLIGSFGWATATFFICMRVVGANEDKRINDNKAICADVKKEDGILRSDFLVALNNMRLEQKADMVKLSDKVDDIKEDVAKIKGGMEKKSR